MSFHRQRMLAALSPDGCLSEERLKQHAEQIGGLLICSVERHQTAFTYCAGVVGRRDVIPVRNVSIVNVIVLRNRTARSQECRRPALNWGEAISWFTSALRFLPQFNVFSRTEVISRLSPAFLSLRVLIAVPLLSFCWFRTAYLI